MVVLIVFIWLFVAIFRVYEDYRLEAERLRIELFPVVRGELLTREKEERVTVNKKNKQETTWYDVNCTYRYHWQGTEHEGAQIRPRLKSTGDAEQAQDLYRQLQPERRVKVYVNPAFPEEAYLSPGVRLFTWQYTVGVLLFGFVFPVVLFYVFYHYNSYATLAHLLEFVSI